MAGSSRRGLHLRPSADAPVTVTTTVAASTTAPVGGHLDRADQCGARDYVRHRGPAEHGVGEYRGARPGRTGDHRGLAGQLDGAAHLLPLAGGRGGARVGDAESGAGYLDYMVSQTEFAAISRWLDTGMSWIVALLGHVRTRRSGHREGSSLVGRNPGDPIAESILRVQRATASRRPGRHQDDGCSTLTAAGQHRAGLLRVMPMVDDFVASTRLLAHGAHGVIDLTGYKAVGYRSSSASTPGRTRISTPTSRPRPGWPRRQRPGVGVRLALWRHVTSPTARRHRPGRHRDADGGRDRHRPDRSVVFPFGADISGVTGDQGAKFEYLKSQGYSFPFTWTAGRRGVSRATATSARPG